MSDLMQASDNIANLNTIPTDANRYGGIAYRGATNYPSAISTNNGYVIVCYMQCFGNFGIQIAVGGDNGETVIRKRTGASTFGSWVKL